MRARDLDVALIIPDPSNRPAGGVGDLSGLAASIKSVGVLHNVVVYEPDEDGMHLLLDGERRWRAAIQAGLGTVPATIKRVQGGRATASSLVRVIANWNRDNGNPMDLATDLGVLAKTRGVPGIAGLTGLTEGTIHYHLELLDLDEATQARIRNGTLKVGLAHKAVRGRRRAANPGYSPSGRRRPARCQPWFDATHVLAVDARMLCDSRKHPVPGRLGGVACGECFEETVRDDVADQARAGQQRGTADVTS